MFFLIQIVLAILLIFSILIYHFFDKLKNLWKRRYFLLTDCNDHVDQLNMIEKKEELRNDCHNINNDTKEKNNSDVTNELVVQPHMTEITEKTINECDYEQTEIRKMEEGILKAKKSINVDCCVVDVIKEKKGGLSDMQEPRNDHDYISNKMEEGLLDKFFQDEQLSKESMTDNYEKNKYRIFEERDTRINKKIDTRMNKKSIKSNINFKTKKNRLRRNLLKLRGGMARKKRILLYQHFQVHLKE